ncbi:hypothetical protein CBA19CS22_34480 [Caballeronia novacaledonica]|uniref:Uncharacterized protein n=1 Tax=Caballeronia novacaledonica TaxID=1544861 RepID=A0ACB5R3V0_9BURK|nr:hypothetical protein CBA19CS22_34480 [Caballeronia novacaledonica]
MPNVYKTVYHLPLQESLHMASISNVLSTCGGLACALLIDRVGRRRWAMACFIISGILFAALAFMAQAAHGP